ncbi:MAG: cytochrome c maturation protein CcmE, partial [Acidimicrobiia bacterium]
MTDSVHSLRTRGLRARYVIAGIICLAVIGGLLWFGLTQNIVYYRTVAEAVDTRSKAGTARFRLAGAVVPGSI